MTLLYQFALSHYCEKVRWALDFKKIPYGLKNLVPGPHLFITRRMASQTTLPILVHEGKAIQDSTAILDFLETLRPEPSLDSSNENQKKEALEWEEYLDEEIGPHLRRFFYHTMLDHRKKVMPLLLQDAPAYAPVLYAVIFPVVRKFMRKAMNIHAESARRSEERLQRALDRLNQEVSKKKFLVGDAFSRADLTAAALLAPLCTPPEHPFRWPAPDSLPEPISSFRKDRTEAPFYRWVLGLYKNYRRL